MSIVFGIIMPYAAAGIFLIGVVVRVLEWMSASVPFRIPTTTGQQKSLPWIKPGRLESPYTALGVVGRMALEILLFRSLFRNSRATLRSGTKIAYSEEKVLWLGALAFHWSFLIIILRHLRYVLEPVPRFVLWLQTLDGFFQVGAPVFYVTDAVIMAALIFLLLRRLCNRQVRYLSLLTDYVALGLLLGLVSTGIWMRYVATKDIVAIKEFAMGLAIFSPRIPENVGVLFYVHLSFVSALLAYFPFSKLMHMAGAFLSPARIPASLS